MLSWPTARAGRDEGDAALLPRAFAPGLTSRRAQVSAGLELASSRASVFDEARPSSTTATLRSERGCPPTHWSTEPLKNAGLRGLAPSPHGSHGGGRGQG